MGYEGHAAWELRANGFKDAADIVAERVLETQRHNDFLIYPIAFLYRHYLELRLKEIIMCGQELLDQTLDLQHIHQLDVLWNSCRKVLEGISPGLEVSDLDAVEGCIRQFSAIDPSSMSFRYPTTRDGQVTLQGLQHVDIQNLKEVVERISSFLEAVSMGISAYLDDKRSMDRFFR